jgi:hypothetical protein
LFLNPDPIVLVVREIVIPDSVVETFAIYPDPGSEVAHESDTCLAGANLLPYYSEHAEADLSDVDLSVYDDELSFSTQLENANLSGADLTEADLRRVNLRDATGWTEKQLTAAKSLEGATMPNGQKCEEWLKDKEGRGEDGENSDSS